MKQQKRKQYLGLIVLLIIILAIGAYLIWHNQKPAPITVTPAQQTSPSPQSPEPQQSAGFNKTQFSLTDATSLWVIVNKQRPLPDGYTPAGLTAPSVPLRLSAGTEEMKMRPDAGAALKELVAGANIAGYHLLLASGYRSQATQKALYARYVAQDGAAAADTYSARAGYSEHQTGLAVDVGRADHTCEVEECFGNTADGQWVAANAHKYGFVIRYPKDKQNITGYIYEPWHLRYVGNDCAQAVHDSGLTLEEFFGLPSAPRY